MEFTFGNNYYGEDGNDLALGNKGTVIVGGGEPNIVGSDAADTQAHMRNFFDCIRSRKEPNCPFELGFSSAIACQMAIASLRQSRSVEWDPEKEDIV